MLEKIRLILKLNRLPLKTIPPERLVELTKQEGWLSVGEYPRFVEFRYLEIGTDGNFRYSYERVK